MKWNLSVPKYGVLKRVYDHKELSIFLALFFFGFLGYLLRRFNFDLAPLILGFILGPIMETSALQSLIMSGGKFNIFFSSTITVILLGLVFVVLATAVYSGIKKGKVSKGLEALKREMEASEEKP